MVYLEVTEFGAEEGFATNSPFNLYDLDIAPYIGEEEEPNGSATVIGAARGRFGLPRGD